ncbi:MAG TPA: S-layer homology domain-containing protein [Candidatus Cryosericum sp.]|nr:S-layer homology domain-containing protein [Candidatus Cryosericum sp.]
MTGNNNGDGQAVVGELITYEVTLTVPEGVTPAATVVDNLGAGLAYVGPVTVTNTDTAHVSFSGTPGSPAVTNSGATVAFSFGDVTDTDTNNAVVETITLSYLVVVLNVGGNTPGTSLHNTATLSWTGGAGASASAPDTQLVQPQVTVVKSASPSTGDAGDEVTFSISVINLSLATGTDAYDVAVEDVIPPGLDYVAGSLAFTAGTPAAPAPVLTDSGAPRLTVTWSLLPWNTQGTITFRAKLGGTVSPRQSLTNTVSVTYTTLSGTPSPSPRSSYNTDSTERTLSTSSSAGVTVASLADSKGMVTTSEASTTGADVVIGEIVRYHLAVKLPEGQSTQFDMVDALPAGLTFLNDGTAKVAFVASGSGAGSGIVSTAAGAYGALAGVDLQMVGASNAVIPSFVVPTSNITPGSFADGTDPVFHLGTLTNYDGDSDDEYVVLEFNAVVSNVAANVANRNLDNTFTVNVGGVLSGFASNSVRVTVREPALATTKTITHAPVDAGDTATYKIVVTNTGNATAFDVGIKDLLSAWLDLRSTEDVTITTDDAVVPANVSQVTAGADTVEVTASSLAASKTLTVTVTVHVADNLPDGQLTIDNTATTTWTSLLGSGTSPNYTGSVAGTSGSTTGERTGAGTAPNTYVSSSTATMTLHKPVHLYKDIVEINGVTVASRPYRVQPGDTVRFRLRVENQGAQPVYNTDLYDTLPAGWTINGGTSRFALTNGTVPSTWTATANPHGSPYDTPPTAPGGTSNVQWHVRQTLEASDDAGLATGTAKDTLYLEFVATVTSSAAASAAGTQNLNQADVAATTDAAGSNQLPANVIDKQYSSDWALVYKPQLLITKSVLSINGNSANVTQAQAGDTVTYRVIVRNTSAGATATAVSVTDTIPPTMAYVTGSSSATWSGGSSTADPTGSPSVWTWPASRVLAGENLLLTYSARVSSTTSLGRNTNSASASAHDTATGTLAATAPDGSPTVAAQIDVHKPVLRVTKTASAAGVAVGTPVDFTIKLESLDSYAVPQAVGLVDTLPAGWTYAAGTTFLVKNSGTPPATWGSAVANPTIAGQQLTWNLASTLDATDDQGGASGTRQDTLWLKFTAVPGPTAEGTANVNTVSASFKDASGTAMPSVQDSVTICVGSPRLEMTKTVDQGTTGVNQTRTFTLKVVNQNAVPANSVNVDDYLPAGWQFIGSSASWVLNNGVSPSWPGTAVTPTIDGTRLTFATSASVAGTDDAGGASGSANDTLWVQFQATATSSAVQGVNTNTAVATGIDPGNHPVGSSMGSVPVTVSKPELSISKTATPETQVVGQNVTFTITVRNTGNQACTGAVVTDTLPVWLAYVSSSPAATVSSGTVTFDAVSVPANGTATFTVVARVMKNAPDRSILTNSALVNGKDGAGNTITAGPATTTVAVSAPLLTVNKTGAPNPVKAGGTLEYTISITNGGSQAATGVTVTDPVPANVTFVSADNGGVNTSGVVSWTGLTVSAGGSLTLHWSGTVANPIADNTQLTNTATVDSVQAGPVSSAPAVNVVSSAPQLNICKTASQNPVRAGNTFTYTIRYANTSTMDVTGALISETYPTGVTFVSASPAPTSGNNTWSIGNLGAGSSGIITITVAVGGAVTDGTTLNNVVTLTSNETQPIQGSVSTTVGTAPALHITKDDLEDPAPSGGTVTYRLTWSNTGSTAATGVTIVDDFSGLASLSLHGGGAAPVTYASFATSTGSPVTFTVVQSGTLLTFTPDGGSLPGLSSGWIDVTFNVPAGVENGTTGTNKVTLKSTETNDVTDTESTTFSSLPALHIVKTGPSSVTPGTSVTYHIEFWNDGAAPATGVVIAETYGSYLQFESATTAPDTGTDNLWTIGTVANDSVHHAIDVTCTVASPLANGTSVVNTATIDSDQTAPQTAGSTGTVGSGPLLTITKTVTGSPVTPGQNLVYTTTIGNTGTAAATGVTVTDTLPSSTAYVSARFVSGSGTVAEASGTVTWTLAASLAPGQQVVVELVAKANTPLDTGTTITNTAKVVCTEESTGVTASVDATVSSAPLLHLTKDAPANVDAGGDITYTLHVTNTGTMNAHGTVVTDVIPAHTTLVNASITSGGTGLVDTTTTPGTVKWTLSSILGTGSELVLQLVVRADAPLPNGTVITNTASVTSAEVPTPVSGSASTTIGSAPVLTITKTVTPAGFTPGGQLTYTITLSNTGNMNATGVTIVDITPPHTTFVSAVFTKGTGAVTAPAVGGTGQVMWTPDGGTLAQGGHITVTLVLQTANPLPTGTVITNTAIGDSAETQQVTSDALATAAGAPVLTFTKTAFPLVQAPGGTITWALALHNSGTATATGVVVTESYDGLFAYQFANPVPDAGTTNRWTVGEVAPGATFSITIVGQLSPAAALTTPAQAVRNTATASCAELGPVSASAAVTVQAPSFWDPGHVTNYKTVSPSGNVGPGTRLMYTNFYGNAGNAPATGVTISDYLDPNLDESSLNISGGGSYDAGTRTISWVLPVVPAGGTGSVSFTVAVRSGFDGGYVYNRSSVGLPGQAPTVTNTVTTWVYPAPVTPPTPPAPPVAAPAVTLTVRGPEQSICVKKQLNLGVTWPDGTAPFAWTVDYGDGSAPVSGTTNDRQLSLTHQYAAVGSYVVTVKVTAAGAAQSSYQATVTITPCPETVLTVYHQNFFIGYPDKPFLPERPISRAEVAGALSRALGLGWSTADPHYADLRYTHWATGFIALMQDEGIMMGDTGGTFRPDAFITRAEAAAVFLRLLDIAPAAAGTTSYPDVPADHWAAGVIAAMKNVGLIAGYPDGTFHPDDQIKRSEFAVLACRALGRQIQPTNELKDVAKLVRWDDVPETYWAYWAIMEVSTPHLVTKPVRLTQLIQLKHKTIPLYVENTDSIVTFLRLGDTVTAIVPVDGLQSTGADPVARKVQVKIINHDRP